MKLCPWNHTRGEEGKGSGVGRREKSSWDTCLTEAPEAYTLRSGAQEGQPGLDSPMSISHCMRTTKERGVTLDEGLSADKMSLTGSQLRAVC